MAKRAIRIKEQPDPGVNETSREDVHESQEISEHIDEVPEPSVQSGKTTILGWAFALIGLAWVGFSIWLLTQRTASFLLEIVIMVMLVSGPLILLSLLWLIFGRSSRRETKRFRSTITEMQQEIETLENSLGALASRMEDNYARLAGEAAKLMTLGDEASDRLGRVTHYLAKETASLDKKAERLETAANMARVDIGVLIGDLPRAEEQAKAVLAAMNQARSAAMAEAGQLENQFAALVASGLKANEVVGGAAQKLATHLTQIESSTTTAKTQLDEATTNMTGAVDATMARTAEAVDAARSGLEAQGRAMLAMIERGRTALERAGEDSWRSLGERLEQISAHVDALATHIANQDAACLSLTTRLAQDLEDLDERFTTLGQTGHANNELLNASVETVRTRMQAFYDEVSNSQTRTNEIVARAHMMAQTLNNITGQLQGDMPTALIAVEEQTTRTRLAAEGLASIIKAVQITASDAANQTAATEASIMRQQEALDTLLIKLRENVASVEQDMRSLSVTAEEASTAAGQIIMKSGPGLVETLVRVREAASQAANQARETIAAAIPQAVADLSNASQHAVQAAVSETVRAQIDELSALSQRAVETARAASEQLTRQMFSIGEAAATVEARIQAGRREREEADNEGFSRRVSFLIESLNSAAIDVNRILSNDVADSEWVSYLKGDRGVFTRRAVRLLDTTETRIIVQYYQTEIEFREQVNRYIRDFEAMLQRILSERDSTALGVTILSSDMGKLYVALAQAIERLRP